jgi:hypothetical protein
MLLVAAIAAPSLFGPEPPLAQIESGHAYCMNSRLALLTPLPPSGDRGDASPGPMRTISEIDAILPIASWNDQNATVAFLYRTRGGKIWINPRQGALLQPSRSALLRRVMLAGRTNRELDLTTIFQSDRAIILNGWFLMPYAANTERLAASGAQAIVCVKYPGNKPMPYENAHGARWEPI